MPAPRSRPAPVRAARLAGLGLVLPAVLLAAPAADAATPADRAATRCTITGTPGDDVLRGTGRADVICGLGGNDTLLGAGGNDTLMGGAGKDVLDAGDGRDVLIGGPQRDRLASGVGADVCADDPTDVLDDPCPVDATGPVLTDVDAPATVVAGSTLTVTWTLADPAGIRYTDARIGGPSGWVRWCDFGEQGSLVSGTDRAGTWSASCDFPADAVNASYSVFLFASDAFGNTTSPRDSSAEVVVTEGSDDAAAPVVSDIDLPATARAGEAVTLTWRATDDTGIDYTFPWVAGPNGRLTDDAGFFTTFPDGETQVSGTGTDGVFSLTVTLRADAPAGRYTVAFSRGDVVGNRAYDDVFDSSGEAVGFTVG